VNTSTRQAVMSGNLLSNRQGKLFRSRGTIESSKKAMVSPLLSSSFVVEPSRYTSELIVLLVFQWLIHPKKILEQDLEYKLQKQ